MKLKDRTDTHQFDWSFYTHDAGAATAAAKEIVNGKTIKFALFDRDKNDSTHMIYKGHCFIGLSELGNDKENRCLALRYSTGLKLEEAGSHSLIPSWNQDAGDVVLIAATIARRLSFEATDFFIDTEECSIIPLFADHYNRQILPYDYVNGYLIRFNSMFDKYIVSHDEVGAGLAEFDKLSEAKQYCLNG